MKSSILRYFKNNFTDGYKQDGVNLLLGDYVVDPLEGVSTPSQLAPNAPMSRIVSAASASNHANCTRCPATLRDRLRDTLTRTWFAACRPRAPDFPSQIPSALLLCCFGIIALGSLQPDSVPLLQQFRRLTLLLTLLLIAVIYRQARQLVNNPQLVRNLSHAL